MVNIHRDTNSLPWIDSEVRHWIRKKYTALKKFCLNKTPERKRKLRILSQTVKVLVRTKHQRYLTKIEASFKDNPKNFWSYHKAFLGGQSGANLTISYNHEVAETPIGKAELFNKYFCSVFHEQLMASITVNILPALLSLLSLTILLNYGTMFVS